MVSVGIAVLMFQSPGVRNTSESLPWVILVGMILLPLAVIGIDMSLRRKELTVITSIYFGLLIGVFLTYVAILALTPLLSTLPASPILGLVPSVLGMILCYICTSLLLQTRDDFRFIIPYVEFARDVKGLRPNVLDASAIIDGRVTELAESGLFQSRFVVPSFVVDELQEAAESGDKFRRIRGRRGLDVLARLRVTAGGVVKSNTALDFETTAAYSFTVTVTDSGATGDFPGAPALSASGTVYVDVQDMNEPPSVAPTTLTVPENSVTGLNFGAALVGTDPDRGQTLSYTVVSGNSVGAVGLNPCSGQFSTAVPTPSNAVLDFETAPV
jgi:hypothetical protein